FQKTYTQDGVCLTESGLCQLQSLSVPSGRRRRAKPKLRLRIINQNSVAVLQAPGDPQSEFSREGDMDDSKEGDLMDCDGKSDSSPEREPNDEEQKNSEGLDGIKKRKRKPYRPGADGDAEESATCPFPHLEADRNLHWPSLALVFRRES
ncbi:histone-lysine N-methyltransferase 2C isoform X1, partial [Tachysurus ichikawai]